MSKGIGENHVEGLQGPEALEDLTGWKIEFFKLEQGLMPG